MQKIKFYFFIELLTSGLELSTNRTKTLREEETKFGSSNKLQETGGGHQESTTEKLHNNYMSSSESIQLRKSISQNKSRSLIRKFSNSTRPTTSGKSQLSSGNFKNLSEATKE